MYKILTLILLLLIFGCYTTDTTDDSKEIIDGSENSFIDSILTLFPDVEIDSSYHYIKSGTSLTVLDSDTNSGYIQYYSYQIDTNSISLVLKNVSPDNLTKTTINLTKLLGDSGGIDENAWLVNEVKLEENDTFAVYNTLIKSEVIIYYLKDLKLYKLLNHIPLDSICALLSTNIQMYLEDKDSLEVKCIFDSLIALAGSSGIDSSMNYKKYNTNFIFTNNDSNFKDTSSVNIIVSDSNALMEINIIDIEDTINILYNYKSLLGKGDEFIGTAWLLNSITLDAFDTNATYTLNTKLEKHIIYLLDSTVYMIENGVLLEDILDTLITLVTPNDTVDTTIIIDTTDTNKVVNLIDSLISLSGSAIVDSSYFYHYNNDAVFFYNSSDSINYKYVNVNEILLLKSLIDSFEIIKSFENFKTIDTIGLEKNIWKLKSITVMNKDSAVSQMLTSKERYLIYLKNGTLYKVEDQINIPGIIDTLINKFPKFGNPVGVWFVNIMSDLQINTDTSFTSDTINADFVSIIFNIMEDRFLTYEYNPKDKFIDVNELMIDISKGGEIKLGANTMIEAVEKDSILTINFINDYTDYGGAYQKETYICKPYYGDVPPKYWVVDTVNSENAILINTNGVAVIDTIENKDSVQLYKYEASAGKVYMITSSSINDNITFDVFFIKDNMSYYLKDDENFAIISVDTNNTHFIEMSTPEDNSIYSISVKDIGAVPTPENAIGNWYLSALPMGTDTIEFKNPDSTLWYLTIAYDSMTIYQQENGVKGTIEGNIYFSSDNKLYMQDTEFSFSLTDTILVMDDDDISLIWKKHYGISFPPDKYIDISNLMRNRKILKLFK